MRPINIPVVILIALLGVFALAWHEQLALYDWGRLVGYKPPNAVSTLATQTTMTPYARHLFYVYHPQLEASTQFNRDCSVTPQVIVLGCTVSFQGIYLYDVSDPQLTGLEQTTAAYEMLHVGYSRLSSSERTRIDALVRQAYLAASETDPQLVQEEQSYLKTEGAGAVANELHSMMGTEVAKLPPALEDYYRQYFTNRQTVLAYKNEYESVFISRQNTVSRDDAELANWKSEIASNDAQLSADNQKLNAQYAMLKSLLSSGETTVYNAGVTSYNQGVASETGLSDNTQRIITEYNQVVAARNAVAVQVDTLDQTISSQPLGSSASTLATP
jgi:hypothetical protein